MFQEGGNGKSERMKIRSERLDELRMERLRARTGTGILRGCGRRFIRYPTPRRGVNLVVDITMVIYLLPWGSRFPIDITGLKAS